VIRQSEFFLYSEKDKEAVANAGPEVPLPGNHGLDPRREGGFQTGQGDGAQGDGILTSVSDYHIFLKLKKTRRAVLREYLSIVSAALDLGVVPVATSRT